MPDINHPVVLHLLAEIRRQRNMFGIPVAVARLIFSPKLTIMSLMLGLSVENSPSPTPTSFHSTGIFLGTIKANHFGARLV